MKEFPVLRPDYGPYYGRGQCDTYNNGKRCGSARGHECPCAAEIAPSAPWAGLGPKDEHGFPAIQNTAPPATVVAEDRWVASVDAENFPLPFYPDRDAAIIGGRERAHGREFWVARAVDPIPPENWWDAAGWLDAVSESEGYSGDHADGWRGSSSRAQEEELEAQVRPILARWLDKHDLRPKFYNVMDEEPIDTEGAPE